jgi:hypothetical protein
MSLGSHVKWSWRIARDAKSDAFKRIGKPATPFQRRKPKIWLTVMLPFLLADMSTIDDDLTPVCESDRASSRSKTSSRRPREGEGRLWIGKVGDEIGEAGARDVSRFKAARSLNHMSSILLTLASTTTMSGRPRRSRSRFVETRSWRLWDPRLGPIALKRLIAYQIDRQIP